MARKRLSDLLREEAQKPGDDESEPSQNGTRRRRTASKAKEETAPNPSPSIAVEAGNPAAIAPNNEPNIDDLKALLEQAHQREVDLQQKVYALQLELDKQTDLVKTLQGDQEKLQAELAHQSDQVKALQGDQDKTQSLKIDLDQAKKAALQLAEENTRLHQEVTSLRDRLSSPPPQAPPSAPAKTAALTKKEAILQQQTQALAHPVFPTSALLPGQLSDKDLGWVD